MKTNRYNPGVDLFCNELKFKREGETASGLNFEPYISGANWTFDITGPNPTLFQSIQFVLLCATRYESYAGDFVFYLSTINLIHFFILLWTWVGHTFCCIISISTRPFIHIHLPIISKMEKMKGSISESYLIIWNEMEIHTYISPALGLPIGSKSYQF